MIAPPSVEELKSRLKCRNSETEEQIQTRLSRLEYELAQKDKYDYVLINDDLQAAIARLEQIIDNEKNKL